MMKLLPRLLALLALIPIATLAQVQSSSNVINQFTGTCNSGTYLRGDGTCATPAGSTSGVNLISAQAYGSCNWMPAANPTTDVGPCINSAIAAAPPVVPWSFRPQTQPE